MGVCPPPQYSWQINASSAVRPETIAIELTLEIKIESVVIPYDGFQQFGGMETHGVTPSKDLYAFSYLLLLSEEKKVWESSKFALVYVIIE